MSSNDQANQVATPTGQVTLGGYRVLDAIGPGRLGNIFHAVQDEFGQHVSLKVFPRGLDEAPDELMQVQRELRVAVQLDHPYVVRTFQVGRIADTYFLAMENLEGGESLASRLGRDGKLPYATACEIARDVAMALEHLHDHDVIHRDVSPENIWITPSGAAKLMEFSAARDPLAYLDAPDGEHDGAAAANNPDEMVGTYRYMAPEQALDPALADARSDIYSLGCVLYQCLTGHPPFENANPTRLMMRHAMELPQPASEANGDVPAAVSKTLDSMFAKDPNERFQSAKDVVWAMEQFFEAAAAAAVEVVELSPEYVEWCREKNAQPAADLENAVGMSPELVSFLDVMTERRRQRKR
jgi:serine/threonine-protein kinase